MTDIDADNRRRAEDFVREVEAALHDLPPGERADLTAGLVEHLLEPGEEGSPLLDEQPEPREYAAELRTSAVWGSAVSTGTPRTMSERRRRSPIVWASAAVVLVILVGAGVALALSLAMSDEDLSVVPTASHSVSPALVAVPDVVGLTQEEAVQQLLRVGLALESVLVADPLAFEGQPGFVVETNPAAGDLVDSGTAVELVIPAEG